MNAAEHNPVATADYLATFGLQQAPYLDSIDMRFFYADPSLIQRLDILQHLTQFGDMLLGVSGPVGSGKTTLAQQFLQRANTAWRICRLSGAHIRQPDELLAKLAECFGLQSTATPERLGADLVRHCQTLRHNAQLAVLVIDDAHQLSDPTLKALLELADDPRETLKLLRIVLFSEAGLEQRLGAFGWHSPQHPLLHNLDIPRFDEQQTAAYLMYRLAVAGYSGESPFSLTEIRALYKAADGLPGKLNVLAHETLVERAGRIAARKNVAPPGSRRIQPVMVLGLIGSLIAGGLAWYLSQEQTAQEPLAPPLTSAPPDTPIPSPVLPAEPAATLEKEPQKSLETTPGIRQSAEIKIESPAGPPPQPASTPDTPANVPAPTPTAGTVVPTVDSTAQPSQPAATTTASAKPAAPPEMAATAPAPTPMATPAGKPEPAEKSPLPPPADTVVASKPRQPAAPATVAKPEQLGTDWLQSRPGAHFTLQLLGGRSEKSLREYLKKNPVPEPVATFRTVFKGDDWYVLVYGEFPSMTAAQQAVATLPPAVRRGKPWPRSFASVHDAIRK